MFSSMLPNYRDVVIATLNEIDLLLKHYVFNGYHALSTYLSIPLGIIAAIYIVIFGYAIMSGWIQVKMGIFIKTVLKIGFIYMAVTQWSFVAEYFVNFIDQAIGGMGDALIGASPVHIPGADGIDGAMQIVLIQFTKLGSVIFNTGGMTNIGPLLDGAIIWAFGYLIVGIGLFEIILAKVMLAVLFVFTPLIVIFCYFKPMQSIFDRWLGAIIGFALLQLFVTAALTLALSLAYWWVGIHIGESALNIGNYGTLPIVIVGIISIGLVLKAAHLAQNLGGVATSMSGSAMVGGMVGGFAGSAVGGLRLMRKGAKGMGGIAKGSANLAKAGASRARSMMNSAQKALRGGGEK